MKQFSNILRQLRISDNLTQKQLADALGLAFSTISMYERGEREPDFETMEAIADYFNVTMDYLHGKTNNISFENIIPLPNMNKIPLLGTIACGEPILAEENIESEINIPEDIRADFALRCKGDSMVDARIMDGDIVYIRQQPTVNNGEIAAVLIGDEATLKRVYLSANTVTLMPCNPKYQPYVYTNEQLNEIRILGKAIGFTSTVF
ncbi:MAG: repressor LexA [Clostridia bacterium]|nr:repressor LexA [Clostridia bacterium]MBR6509433.1 repressor LexA [Clostridia bacterium]